MIPNQVFQNVIESIKETVGTECSVWSMQGRCLVSTCDDADVVKKDVDVFRKVAEDRDMQISADHACLVIKAEEEILGILALHSITENIEIIGKLCVQRLEEAYRQHERRFGKSSFFQQLLLDNMLLIDVYNQAKKLHVETEAKRVVFVVEPKKQKDNTAFEIVKGLYASGDKDFVTSVDEGHIILIKALDRVDDYEEVNNIAKSIVDMLSTEALVDARVAYGTIVYELKDVSTSYKEAHVALDVGRIFYPEKTVLAYNELGIGRLIHQLPTSLCEMFLQEVFQGTAVEHFDNDTLVTVNAFFENNLNISETARKMYLHRNTLGYRLEKIMKTTGLDVKKFDDALTFKIALMVSDHLRSLRTQE